MHKKIHATLVICSLVFNVFTAIAEPISDRITVTVRGTGPDVLLIPGLTSSSAVWDDTVKRFEGHYRLHLVQLAGFAGSPSRANASGPVIQPTVSALDAYILTNNLHKPSVIGHSLGGLMGMMLALQHPEDTGKLMIVDSFPFLGVLTGAKDAAAAEPQAAARRDKILSETQEAYAQGERQFLPSLVKSPEGLKAATEWAIASDKAVVARAFYEVMTTDLRPKLSEIRTPVTVLYPWDPAHGFAQANTDRLYQGSFASLPNKTVVCISDSYHFIMLDQPDVFAAKVEDFLK
jgi:pimeloyl-ACP methyl ester carboxylesterase